MPKPIQTAAERAATFLISVLSIHILVLNFKSGKARLYRFTLSHNPSEMLWTIRVFKSRSPLLPIFLALAAITLVLSSRDRGWSTKLYVYEYALLAWVASLVNWIFGGGPGQLRGIRPRQPLGLVGIAFSPFLHKDVKHLLANTLPF